MINKESFTLNGENLLKEVKALIAEGNISRVTITDKNGKELISFAVTMGLAAALIAPVLATVGALAAFVSECTVTVERTETAV